MLQQTATNTTNNWAEQQNNFIPIINGQARMEETLQDAMQQKKHSPTVCTNEAPSEWTQKIVTSPTEQIIVASPTEPNIPQPCFILQEDANMPQAPNQLVDNTKAKQMTWAIMQEFAPPAMDHTVPCTSA